MSEPLRYIVIGAGGEGALWCRNVLPRLKALGKAIPVAAVDTSLDRLKLPAEYLELPPQHCYTDASEAIEKRRADFAVILVPVVHQEKTVDLALSFDLDILSAGPIAESMEAACRIYRKVRGIRRKRMAVVMERRYDPDVQTLESLVRGRKFGRLNYLVVRFTETCRKQGVWGIFRPEVTESLLVENAFHHFDVLRGLTEDNGKAVLAVSWNPPWGEFRSDSTGFVLLEMGTGVNCFYEGSKANASSLNGFGNEYFRAECEQATIELDHQQVRIIQGSGERPRSDETRLLEQPAWGAAWMAELFCDWLAGGAEPPNTLKDHMYCCALTYAAVEAARIGRPVDVKDFLQKHLEASRHLGAKTSEPRP